MEQLLFPPNIVGASESEPRAIKWGSLVFIWQRDSHAARVHRFPGRRKTRCHWFCCSLEGNGELFKSKDNSDMNKNKSPSKY